MSLRTDTIKAVKVGKLPKVFSVQQLKALFKGKYSKGYLNCFLANSEVLITSSPTYKKCTIRRGESLYEIHPTLLM